MKRTLRPLLWLSLALVLIAGLSVSVFAGTVWYDTHPGWVATHSDPHFDITVRPDDPMTVEELISLTTSVSFWTNGDVSGAPAPRDRNGDLPSPWAAPYIRYYSTVSKAFDPSRVDYDAPATLGFMMRFFASVKGLSSFNANNLYSFTGTEGYNAEDLLLLSVAVDYDLVPYTKDMDVSRANLLRRDLEEKYKIPEDQIFPQYPTVRTAANYRHSLVFFEDTYDYYDVNVAERRAKKYHELENIKAMGDSITMVNMNIQVLNQDGSRGSFLEDDRVPLSPVHAELMDYCRANGIKILCGVLNYYNDIALKAMKDDPRKVEQAADELAGYVDQYGFDGLDMDIEMFGDTYREVYSALMRAVSRRMRERNKLIVGTVGAYFTNALESGSMYDYDVIRETCDLVMIILYDDHSARSYTDYPNAPHGYLSSLEHVRRCLTYAVTRLGADKTLMSVGNYGVDFNLDNHTANGIPRQQVMKLLSDSGAKLCSHPTFDDDTYFSYLDSKGCHHEVYFDSYEALGRRLEFATQYGLAGVCTFYGTSDSPELFDMIRAKLVDLPFRDVARAWYYDPVRWAVQQNVTSGTSQTTFSPDSTCTRAQVVTFLWRAKGCPEPRSTANPFTDVPANQYYTKAVLWAVENGVTNGVDRSHFGPDRGCTRGQVVTFLWRAEGQPDPDSRSNPFRDVDAGAYFNQAVLWAVENQITNGTAADRFSPDSTCTRAQIVTFLYRDLNEA